MVFASVFTLLVLSRAGLTNADGGDQAGGELASYDASFEPPLLPSSPRTASLGHGARQLSGDAVDAVCGNTGLLWELGSDAHLYDYQNPQTCDQVCADAGSSCVALPSGARTAACVEMMALSSGVTCEVTGPSHEAQAPFILSLIHISEPTRPY